MPPSSQFRLIRENVAARVIIDLARSRDIAFDLLAAAASDLPASPVSVIVFGSFGRSEADEQSDRDVIVVRPDDIDADDDDWAAAVERWRTEARAITGNRVEILELSNHEVRDRLGSSATLWRDVLRDGFVVHGLTIRELVEPAHA